jgi:hypothetical protein
VTEIKLTLDDPAKTVALLRDASAAAGSSGSNHTAGMHVRWLADFIEEQVKPAVEQPTEFGSIVRAGLDGLSDRVLWQRWAKGGWQSEEGAFVASFDVLDHPEVLRVGIGATTPKPISEGVAEGFCSCHGSEQALDCGISEHRRQARIHRDPMDDAPEGDRGDVAPEETEDYKAGVSDFAAKQTDRFIYRLQDAISAERKDAYTKAIKDVEELQP